MKKTLLATFLAVCLAQSASAQEDQFSQCRAAEGALSDVSVYIAQGFNSTDLERSQNAIKQVIEQVDKGDKASQSCTCPGIARGVKKTRELMKVAKEGDQIEDIQMNFQSAIVSSEEARFEAEKCWRAAAAAMKK